MHQTKTKTTNDQTMNPTVAPVLLPAPERLEKTVYQTRGLLYALSALQRRHPDELHGDEPNDDEAVGLGWLARDLGDELKELADEIGDDYANRRQAAYLAANCEQKGGAA